LFDSPTHLIHPAFPYTTLFRSLHDLGRVHHRAFKVFDHLGGMPLETDLREHASPEPDLMAIDAGVIALNHACGLERLDAPPYRRSEEHTSELQSRENLVCRLLL